MCSPNNQPTCLPICLVPAKDTSSKSETIRPDLLFIAGYITGLLFIPEILWFIGVHHGSALRCHRPEAVARIASGNALFAALLQCAPDRHYSDDWHACFTHLQCLLTCHMYISYVYKRPVPTTNSDKSLTQALQNVCFVHCQEQCQCLMCFQALTEHTSGPESAKWKQVKPVTAEHAPHGNGGACSKWCRNAWCSACM
jgi:hypothetical protein